MNKTWKREIALLILVVLGALGYFGYIEILEIVIWPAAIYIAGAFGLDWASKQGKDLFGQKDLKVLSERLLEQLKK